MPDGIWRWLNFSPVEIACRGTGKLLVNEPALDKLLTQRDRLAKPLIFRSAYRSPEHKPRGRRQDAVGAHGRRVLRYRDGEP